MDWYTFYNNFWDWSDTTMLDLEDFSSSNQFDFDEQNTDFFSVGKKVRIALADIDYSSWLHEMEKDAEELHLLSLMIADITPQYDTKLQTLFKVISDKVDNFELICFLVIK